MNEKDSGATFDLFSDARPETPDFLSVPADLHAAGPDQAVGPLMLDRLGDVLVDDVPVVTFPDDQAVTSGDAAHENASSGIWATGLPNSTPAIAVLPEARVAGGPLDERAAIPSINESVRDLTGAPDYEGVKLSLDNPVNAQSLTDFVCARMADIGKLEAAMLPRLEQKTVAYLRIGWALLRIEPQPKHREHRKWEETVGARLSVSARRVRDLLGAGRAVPQDKAHLVPRCAVQRPIEEVSRAVANWKAGRDWDFVGERPKVSKTEPKPDPEPEPEGDSTVLTSPVTETSASSSPEAGIEAEWWTEQNLQLWLRLTNLMAAEPQMIAVPTKPFVQAAKRFIDSIVSDNRKMGAITAAATRKRNLDLYPFGRPTPWEPGMPDTLVMFAPDRDNDDERDDPPAGA